MPLLLNLKAVVCFCFNMFFSVVLKNKIISNTESGKEKKNPSHSGRPVIASHSHSGQM